MTVMPITMPASLCPGTVHHAWPSALNGPTTMVSDSPAGSSAVPVVPATLRSWGMAPWFETCNVICWPAGTSMVFGVTENSASVMSNSVSPPPVVAAASRVLPKAPITPMTARINADMPMTNVRTHSPSRSVRFADSCSSIAAS